ncbi:MAG TPA: enoyl-CoA hydratase-related protein, partial [Casimicrobiaceae bacterium]
MSEVQTLPPTNAQRELATPANTLQHWRLERDRDGIAWLTFDKAGATTNTLSKAVLAEFHAVLDTLERDRPRGLVIRSGKAGGFIAGADVDEFGEIRDAAGVREILARGLRTFDRLAKVNYPTLALIRGYCLGGGLEL